VHLSSKEQLSKSGKHLGKGSHNCRIELLCSAIQLQTPTHLLLVEKRITLDGFDRVRNFHRLGLGVVQCQLFWIEKQPTMK
jgi:hypothetical protein